MSEWEILTASFVGGLLGGMLATIVMQISAMISARHHVNAARLRAQELAQARLARYRNLHEKAKNDDD